jgi:hypothetical protein
VLFFGGTFAPCFRASDKPMAIACFLLLTRPPLPPFPDRNVPCFLRRSALATRLLAALPYLAMNASLGRNHHIVAEILAHAIRYCV